MNDFMMYDVSAFFIFGTLIISNMSKNKIKSKANLLYTIELVVCMITIIFRLTFQIILRHAPYSAASVFAAKSFVYLALLSQSFIYPLGIYFVFSLVGLLPLVKKSATIKILTLILSLVPIIYILMDLMSNTIFEIDTNMKLVLLRPRMVLNTCVVVMLCCGFLVACYYIRLLEKIHILYTMILYPLNITLFIIQSMYPQAQVELFVIAVTAYLVFSTIQRPELLINPDTLAQSSIAFESELRKNLKASCNAKIIFIKISNYKSINMYIGNDRFVSLLKKVTLYLRNLSKKEKLNAMVYYLNDYLYALPTENQTDEMIDSALNSLQKYFSQVFITDGIKINLETRLFVIRTPEDVSNFDFLSYISHAFYNIVEYEGKPQWYRDYAADRNFIIKNNIDTILARAIENKSFDVYYQPIYNVEKKGYCSAEALVRLNDPEFGNIPPGMFIAHAERTNQIHIIGDFVIEKVCEFIGSKQGEGLGLDYIEINMSASQCMEKDIVEKMKNWLNLYNVRPQQIRLEITESAASFNPQIVEKNITELKEMGINFALDDYGTGYSDIKKIISLPFDVVKLNKSFVMEIDNPATVSIVEDTIHMLKALGKEILVEGIETAEHAQQFMNLKYGQKEGCEYLQGFYFSRPLPQSEFVKFLTI
ncbi:MAG: EAL domain-containing protein [Treponema sp.]|nr:EAL domain-containing protein [Treponema sp.]